MKVQIGRYPSKYVLRRRPDAEQTVNIRIDPWDTWNMAETLADIILPMLIQLRDESQGSCGSLQPFMETSRNFDGQYTFDWYKDDDEKAHELGHKQWQNILDKMIWSFEQMTVRDRDHQFHKKGKGFNQKEYKEYYERIQEGLDLFGKYYTNLWD